MNTALVKIDVASADLGLTVRRIEQMAEGIDLRSGALVWVFDFAVDGKGGARRDPRFWRPELLAAAGEDGAQQKKFVGYELEWVIAKILPVKRSKFYAGEVDQLFQTRPCTRLRYGDMPGELSSGRHVYARATLVDFLRRRWMGAVYQREKEEGKRQKDEGASRTDVRKEVSEATTRMEDRGLRMAGNVMRDA